MTEIVRRPVNEAACRSLTATGMPPLMARLLAARGIEREDQAFGSINQLLPTRLLKGAAEMAARLDAAIKAGKQMTIVADYDSDGATACAVGILGLRRFGAKIEFVVPNRIKHGYGLAPEIVRVARELTNPDIIITVDNGIASHAGIEEARRLGIEVFVTDHHLAPDTLPDAAVIVNPNQPGCQFPSKNLAGVGVMFYVLMALREHQIANGANPAAVPRVGDLLDLVALGTVADVVKLDENNRILVRYGLEIMRQGKARPLIQELIAVSNKKADLITTRDLGFSLGPRINAAGRIADMALGINGLISTDTAFARKTAYELDRINAERREKESVMQETAIDTAEEMDLDGRSSLVLHGKDWHEGIVGLVASRMKERYYRPTIAFATSEDGSLKGSGRSIPGLHLRDAIDRVAKRHPALIRKFGGHAAAAGLTIEADGIDTFTQAFDLAVSEMLPPGALDPKLETDGSAFLAGEEMPSVDLVRRLDEITWGQGFPPPVFCDTFQVVDQRVVGSGHLKLRLESNGHTVDGIFFGRGEELPAFAELVYRLDVNTWKDKTNLQLMVDATADSDNPEIEIASRQRAAATRRSMADRPSP